MDIIKSLDYHNNLEYRTRRYFYIVLVLSLSSTILGGTEWPLARGFRYVYMISPLLILPRFVIVLTEMKGWKQWFVLFSLPVILYTSFLVLNLYEVLNPYLFTISAYNTSFRRILKYYLVVNSSIWILTTIAAYVHIIPNIGQPRDSFDVDSMNYTGEIVYRYCFGYNYPTNYAAHLTYICIIWFVLRMRRARFVDFVIFLLGAIHIYRNCYAKLDTICVIFFMLFFYLYNYSYKLKLWHSSIAKLYFKYSICLAAFIIVYVTYSFYRDTSSDLYNLINIITSNRLSLGADAIESHGFSLFGQEFEFYFHNDRHGYNFIDSSFMQLLIIYGLFYFIFILFCHIRVSSIYMKSKFIYIPIAISMISLHSILFQGLFSFEYNPFYLGLFAVKDIIR